MFGDTHSHWFWLGLLLGCIMPLSQWTICYATLLEFLWYTLSHQQRMHCPFLQVSASASLFFFITWHHITGSSPMCCCGRSAWTASCSTWHTCGWMPQANLRPSWLCIVVEYIVVQCRTPNKNSICNTLTPCPMSQHTHTQGFKAAMHTTTCTHLRVQCVQMLEGSKLQCTHIWDFKIGFVDL